MNPQAVIFASAFTLISCAQQPKVAPRPTLAPLTTLPAHAPNEKRDMSSLSLLLHWLQGEFNNNAFVVLQKEEAQKTATGLADHPVEHLHATITLLDKSELGPNWLRVSLAPAATPELTRSVKFYELSEVAGELKMAGYQFADPKKWPTPKSSQRVELALSDLRAEPRECTVTWRFQTQGRRFTSDALPAHCQSLLGLTAGSTLSAQNIEVLDTSAQITNRFEKARRFNVLGQISRGLKSPMPTGKYSVVKDVTVHDQGGRTALLMDDGSASGFALELTQKSTQSKAEIGLSLRLINEQTGQVEAESWADAGTDTLGLNLNWIRIRVNAQSAKDH